MAAFTASFRPILEQFRFISCATSRAALMYFARGAREKRPLKTGGYLMRDLHASELGFVYGAGGAGKNGGAYGSKGSSRKNSTKKHSTKKHSTRGNSGGSKHH
jgi:hypothetical protein